MKLSKKDCHSERSEEYKIQYLESFISPDKP